jgi:hypothetical protein
MLMNWMVYLFKVNLALLILLALYAVAFRKLTFFHWNRIYLTGSVLLSFILPLLRLNWRSSLPAAVDPVTIDWTYMDHLVNTPIKLKQHAEIFTPANVLLIIYLAVAMIITVRSASRFRYLGRIARQSQLIRKGRLSIYLHDGGAGSFTLFRSIYLDRYAYEKRLRPVFRHEMVHAVQLHSLDLVFLGFIKVLLWFNPFIYILNRYVRENHEYLADRHAYGRKVSLREYLECLKSEVIRSYRPLHASFFKSSTVKNRIIMLTHHSSRRNKKWIYLGILPVIILTLVLFHTPPDKSMAHSFSEADALYRPAGANVRSEDIPSQFPLSETYRESITWGYNQQAIHPITKELAVHHGIDVAAPSGTPVYATGDGVVIKAGTEEGWGKLIVMEHEDGYVTFYAHLDGIDVETGLKVGRGEVIGRVGNSGQSTGPHLHYEVRRNGEYLDPADFY